MRRDTLPGLVDGACPIPPARTAGQAGFTLIEVLVAMVIIAILAAIAIPAYTQYIARGHRSEARATMMQAAQWMERFRTQNGVYTGAVLPAALNQSPPLGSGPKKYDIAVNVTAPNAYGVTAVPTGTMSGDDCGTLQLDQSGLRGHTGSASDQLCWGR